MDDSFAPPYGAETPSTPLTAPTCISSHNNSSYALEVDAIGTYTVELEKGEKFKYGIAYRVFDSGVTLMGVLRNSPGDAWNMVCDPDQTLCAGDRIIDANQQNLERAIVDELLNSTHIVLQIQKTGPRWHIIGDGAQPKEYVSSEGAPMSVTPTAKSVQTSHTHDEEIPEEPLRIVGWLYLFSAVFVPNLLLLGLFSSVGVGLRVFTAFSPVDRNMQGNGVVFLGSCAAVALVVFDFSKWKSQYRKALSAIFVLYFICAGAIMKMRFYPVAPLVIIFFHIPIFLGILKGKVLARVRRKSFYIGVTTSAFSCGMFMLAIWLVWMNISAWDGTNRWGDSTKEQLVMDSEDIYDNFEIKINKRKRPLNYFWDCSPAHKQDYDYLKINAFRYMDANFTMSAHVIEGEENQARGKECARVKTMWFLAYTTPFMCVGLDLIIGIFCLVNGVMINVADTSKLEKVLKQFILMISFLVFTMYVSSSVAGASMRLTGVIMAFCASGIVALGVWLYMEIGRQAITSQVRNSKLMQSLIVLATSDWVRACFLIGCNVLIPSILGINMLNQWIRKKRGLASKDEPRYTAGVYRIILATQHWNWASILVKANWLVILYWTFSVGVAKLTSVFLSYLNEELLKINFVAVIAIFFVIGFTMFMLPPVPGIPVYICSGIVLSARARDIPEVGGFWGGMCIAVLESLVLKICAVCGQYMIGYGLGKSVKVQQLVSVDKVFTRAIEFILDTRGLNLPKVSVLVGGPDWPTSVLCGILKLNLPQTCLGTLPVIFVSAPCVVAGALLSNPGADSDKDARRLSTYGTTTPPPREKEDETWTTLSTTALAVSFMLQLAGMVLALYYIQEVVQREGEILGQPRPEHEAVAALTRREADYVAEYNSVLNWATLLTSRKRLIIASTVSMLMSTFMFVMMDEACFRSFQVSSRISEPYEKDGLQGNVLNLVMPLGWFATICFFFASSLHFAFLRWARTEASKRLVELMESRPPPLEDDDED